MGDFSHLSNDGTARMVDISGKADTARLASVCGVVSISTKCSELLGLRSIQEVITTARLAGIQASKLTSQLIPLCHQVPLSRIDVDVKLDDKLSCFQLSATASSHGSTGVEMEALTAVTVAGLTIYDMIKAVDPGASVGPFRLLTKSGGKHGPWSRPDE
jgi:cyclic pyranopterin monophosphate synthase